jgi:twitching motility protein PilT
MNKSFFLEPQPQFRYSEAELPDHFEANLAAPGTAPIQISLDSGPAGAATDDLLAAILRANARVSDLIFSPGRKVQIQINGSFVPVEMAGVPSLSADDTRRIASHLIGNNKAAIALLREQGYCDISYALPGAARFRANVFIQRGSCAVVMHVIPTEIPTLETLGAPLRLGIMVKVRNGLVLVTGPRGCGKSSTLGALVNHINDTEACHIITIEDPIEFLHNHKRATVHQRELHSDTPSISHAMHAALRQAPNVIAVGELKDRETMELALDAAETGHLVLSTLNTPNAAKAIERIVGVFPTTEQPAVRERLARMLRCVICQRLIPRKQDGERVGVFQIIEQEALQALLESSPKGKLRNKACTGLSAIDLEIERLLREGVISAETALAHASDPARLSKVMASD